MATSASFGREILRGAVLSSGTLRRTSVPEEILEGTDETVLVFAQESGRGKDSGIEVCSRRITGVYELRDGKIVRFKAYLDRDEALQAAGLRE